MSSGLLDTVGSSNPIDTEAALCLGGGGAGITV